MYQRLNGIMIHSTFQYCLDVAFLRAHSRNSLKLPLSLFIGFSAHSSSCYHAFLLRSFSVTVSQQPTILPAVVPFFGIQAPS